MTLRKWKRELFGFSKFIARLLHPLSGITDSLRLAINGQNDNGGMFSNKLLDLGQHNALLGLVLTLLVFV
jgi:hypothetical protein